TNRVEEGVMAKREARGAQPVCESDGQTVQASRDALQSLRAMVYGVEARDYGEEHLGRAHVRRRLLTADVLFTGLKRHPQRGPPLRIRRDTNAPPGDQPLVLVLRRKERGVRSAEAERHTEALRVADRDVRAPLTGRREQSEREEVARGDHECTGIVRTLRDVA